MIERFNIEGLEDWSIHSSDECDDTEIKAALSAAPDDAFPVTARISSSNYRLIFPSLFAVDFDREAKRVTACKLSDDANDDDWHHILYDHIAPRLLSLDQIVLHGAAIAIEGRLAVLIGETGAGKSTLSASFWQAGYTLLGDDAVIVSETPDAPTGKAVYPSLRLYPETIKSVFDHPVSTAPMAHYSSKRRLELAKGAGEFAPALPLAAIFHLADPASAAEPMLSRMPPAKACFTCMEQSFALDPEDAEAATQRLGALARLVSQVPVFNLDYPREFSVLPRVHDTIKAALG